MGRCADALRGGRAQHVADMAKAPNIKTGPIALSVIGTKEVIARFSRLKGARQRAAMRRGVTAAGQLEVQYARKAAPRQSGILRRSLGKVVKTYAKSNTVVARIGVVRGYEWYWDGQRRIPEMYINAVEGGTKPRRTRSGAFRGKVNATRFLSRAANRAKSAAENRFTAKFRESILKEAAKK